MAARQPLLGVSDTAERRVGHPHGLQVMTTKMADGLGMRPIFLHALRGNYGNNWSERADGHGVCFGFAYD